MSKHSLLLRAQTPIVHGDKTLGTITYLRRERYLSENNEVIEIPTISGNALRGALRDASAELFYDFLEQPELPLPVAHALWSGGKITKATTIPLSGEKLRQVRELAPPLSLLGWSSAGRIVSGSLSIGNVLPVCRELGHLLPDELGDSSKFPSYWDITQLSEYSNFPDVDTEDGTTLMRYGYESFIPGTQFYTWVSFLPRTTAEEGFLAELLHLLTSGRVAVGGNKARGNGLFSGSFLGSQPQEIDWRNELLQKSSVGDIANLLHERIK